MAVARVLSIARDIDWDRHPDAVLILLADEPVDLEGLPEAVDIIKRHVPMCRFWRYEENDPVTLAELSDEAIEALRVAEGDPFDPTPGGGGQPNLRLVTDDADRADEPAPGSSVGGGPAVPPEPADRNRARASNNQYSIRDRSQSLPNQGVTSSQAVDSHVRGNVPSRSGVSHLGESPRDIDRELISRLTDDELSMLLNDSESPVSGAPRDGTGQPHSTGRSR